MKIKWFCRFEARQTHKDYVSVRFVFIGVVDVVVRGVTLLVSDQYFVKGCINFIQSLQNGSAAVLHLEVIDKILTELSVTKVYVHWLELIPKIA